MVTVSGAESFSDASASFLPPPKLLLLLHHRSCASGPSRITPDMIISPGCRSAKGCFGLNKGLHSPSAEGETSDLSGRLVITFN